MRGVHKREREGEKIKLSLRIVHVSIVSQRIARLLLTCYSWKLLYRDFSRCHMKAHASNVAGNDSRTHMWTHALSQKTLLRQCFP